jgi:ribosomal protein L11 methyltransferase
MFVEIEIHATGQEAELLGATLFELGASGLEERASSFVVYFENTTKAELDLKLADTLANFSVEYTEKIEENWMENWKENFKPVFLGEFVVKPTWESVETDKQIIEIDPKMAFGTGTHETTQLILEHIHHFVKAGDTLLDVGTGSGILAIAAEKLGAIRVHGLDNDPLAIENANENAVLNHCKSSTTFKTELITDVDGCFDVLLANINKHILLDISDELIRRLTKGGYLLLSGLLVEDRADIKHAYSKLELVEEKIKGEWALLVFKS